ncbi:MAG: N-glycosylase/DNA lyase [Aquificae bacterium]|nr:N-glycosylase/DNA lyase [Aquificota bacterium]
MRALEKIKEVIPKVKHHVEKRIKEFEKLRKEGKTHYDFRPFLELDFPAGVFSELSFCILTANSSATLGLKIQSRLGDEGFMTLKKEELEEVFRKHGHRYASQRAERIVLAREKFGSVLELLRKEKDPKLIRELLSSPKSPYKIKGFAYKEASHFLRNVGFKDVAIVDRHIFRFLVENGLLEPVKTLTPKVYLKAEKELEKLAKELGMSVGELDLYIFYLKTKKVLK